jgi:hypothetical protein
MASLALVLIGIYLILDEHPFSGLIVFLIGLFAKFC